MASTGTSTLHGALTDRLKELGADKSHLMDVANKLAKLDASQILGKRIWVRGIPAVDQIGLTSVVNAKFLGELVAQLTSIQSLRTLDIFPYGIPFPEIYQVTTTFGNVAVQQETLL